MVSFHFEEIFTYKIETADKHVAIVIFKMNILEIFEKFNNLLSKLECQIVREIMVT